MKVGLIGLGVMGGAMAKRLASRGHTVFGYNRTRQKAEALARESPSIQVCDTPGQAVRAGEVVLSMVAENRALEAVAHGASGILENLQPGQIWVDFSTVSPALSRQLASEAQRRGATRLETPVSGSVSTVEAGALSIFVAGDKEALGAVEPLLRDLGDRIEWVGDPGQALTLKLGINLNIAVQMIGFAEGLLLAERAGLERARATELMLTSVIASPMLKYRVPLIEDPPETPWFTPYMMLKDLKLALQKADETDLPMPLTGLCGDILRYAIQRGVGQQELAAVVDVLTELAGARDKAPAS
jgi:3-hydroxyisobutyrate dehydrogenase-like beta-hydroxyacid dehydrogenase